MRPTWLMVVILGGLAACAAPSEFAEGVAWYAHRDGEHEARAREVDERPFLRIDDYLKFRLEHPGVVGEDARQELVQVLQRGQELACILGESEISRLSEDALRDLHAHYFTGEDGQPAEPWPGAATFRRRILRRYVEEADRWLAAETERVLALDAPGAASYRRALLDAVRPGIKEESRFLDVLAHLPLAPVSLIVVSNIEETEYWGPKPVDEDFRRVRVFEPEPEVSADVDPGVEALLMRHAPVIVQQLQDESGRYPDRDDRVGRVLLARDGGGGVRARVDTDQPSVYAHASTAIVGGRELPQLVYTLIYPEHPALRSPDYEAGAIEAIVFRVTLDPAGRPAVFESVYACGCHHRVRVAERLAREARGLAGSSGGHPLERWRDGELVGLHVVEDVAESSDPTARLTLYQYAGYHMTGGVRLTAVPVGPQVEVVDHARYRVRPYEELEHQRDGDRWVSLFDEDGLVVGAERAESFWMAGAGFFAAGQPRQRGTQRILLDAEDFDDPTLLDRMLALPPSMSGRSADAGGRLAAARSERP